MWTDKERADGCLGALRMIERQALADANPWELLREIHRLSSDALREYERKPAPAADKEQP